MPPFIQHKNRTVRIDQTPIIENALSETFLSADVAASSGTLTVQDIADFATGKYVWIDPFTEKSEIIAMHASTSPSGSTLTLASNTSFAHSTGAKVYYVEFNQVEISHASTLTGSKSVLSTEALNAGDKELRYLDTSQTSGFYFARFKDSVASSFGSYSDGIAYDGWATNTVGYAIQWALKRNNTTLDDTISRTFCYEEINDCLNEIQGKQLRWPQHANLNAIVGQTTRGTHVYSLPSDIYDNDSNKSILSVRIGEDQELRYLDPTEEWHERLGKVKYTQVRTEASANDTTLALDNSYDFADSGSVNVYISGTKYNITYTGVTRDDADGGTAVLTGIPSSGTGSITVTIPVDTYVWQDEEEGEPDSYTVRGGNLETWEIPDANHDNQNIYMDYWTVATEVNSEGDTIDQQRFDMVKYYLAWKIRMQKERNGDLDLNDGFYVNYRSRLNDAIRNKPRGFKHKMHPKINGIKYSRFMRRTRPLTND